MVDFAEIIRKLKSKNSLIIGAIIVVGHIGFLIGYIVGRVETYNKTFDPPDVDFPFPPSSTDLHVYKNAAVCTDAPQCSNIAKHVLQQKGSAVDAAIAAVFCNCILNQMSTSIGGGLFMTVYIKELKKGFVVNAREKAPLSAGINMFDEHLEKARKGPLAAAVPGVVRGLWTAHQKWGKLPWATLLEPTVKICNAGFLMTKPIYLCTQDAPHIQNDLHLSRMYFNKRTNKFRELGEGIIPPTGLCSTLHTIATKGGDDFYNGTLARLIANDLEDAGTIISAEDLRDYRAPIVDPIEVDIGNGDRLLTSPPPSSGILVAALLNILKGYRFTANSVDMTHDKILTYHRMLEAFKFAFTYRNKLGDMDFLDLEELIEELTSPEFGESIRNKISDMMTNIDPQYYGFKKITKIDDGTAHISILAENGDAVSVSSSLNSCFGAGITTFRTGIVLNNVMDDFSTPGFANLLGAKPSPIHYIAPGKRPLSSMSPVIVVDKNSNVKMVVGATGGIKIVTTVAMVIMRALWFNMTIKQAIDAPRFHHQLLPMQVQYEYGMTKNTLNGLKSKGHSLVRSAKIMSTSCGICRNGSNIFANVDFRTTGGVAGIGRV